MDTNERLQQALDELAVAAARLNESAIQLRCVFSDEARDPEPVAHASSERNDFIEKASDKAFKKTFVHQSMAYGAAKQGSVPVNRLDVLARFNGVAQEAHDKALIHALRDVNTDEITEVRANLDHSGNWRATLNAFLARRRLP